MRRITKLFNTKALSIDDTNKRVTFTFSDNKVDRMGEIVDQKSWDFKNYLVNPLILWGHNPDEPENVLGTARSLATEDDGSSSSVEMQFDTDINPKALLVFNQVKAGTLRTVSAGFINHSEELQNDIPVLKDNELIEISVVPIPANPRAIALSLKEGTLSTKDARWLIDGMRKEADILETQIKEQTNEGDNNMDDIKAQLATLTEAVGKLTEQNAELTTKLEEATKPPVESEEEKTAREAKEAQETKDAADKAAADDAAKDKGDDKTDPAKDGSDDQSGAGEGEFDPQAELTPQIQAQIDSALEEAEIPT